MTFSENMVPPAILLWDALLVTLVEFCHLLNIWLCTVYTYIIRMYIFLCIRAEHQQYRLFLLRFIRYVCMYVCMYVSM